MECRANRLINNVFIVRKPDKSDKEALKAYNKLLKPKPDAASKYLLKHQPKFKIGERVHLELKDVPIDQRDNTLGYIINIKLKYPRSDKLRRIVYTVRLDGKYIKPECIIYENIEHDFSCAVTSLRKLQSNA